MNDYKFTCDCEACSNDYPLFDGLLTFDPALWARGFYVPKLSADEAIAEFKNNCDYIIKNADRFPCKELAMIHEVSSKLLLKIAQFASLIGDERQ